MLNNPEFLNTVQVAERYGVKISTVQGWVRRKNICASKIGKKYIFKLSDLKALEESRKTIRPDESDNNEIKEA